MPSDEYAAFLSYSHRDKAWAEVLQENLEANLLALGHEPARVFRDDTDLALGRSWVNGLQQGLDRAPVILLVVTPEAMASPRVEDEFGSRISGRRDWKVGRLQILHLVDCPLPPFLSQIQTVDFREHDEDSYRQGLRKLLGGLLGRLDCRDLPELASGLTIPDSPVRAIPPPLRARLVAWLEVRLASKLVRGAVAEALGLDRAFLEAHPSSECAASAALVQYMGGDDPVKALRRLVEALSEALGEDLPDEVAALEPLARELAELRAGGGLERIWLNKVQREHGRLERYFQQVGSPDLLARVYVDMDVKVEPLGPSADANEDEERMRRGPRELRELLELAPSSAPWVTGRWTVLGDPGAGKTTLLRHLAATLSAEHNPPWIPVYESLPRWLREAQPLPQRLERRLRRAGHPAQGFSALCEQLAADGRLLILLDGLDEVPKEQRTEAEELLGDLAARWARTPIVVASRPIGYRPPAGGFTELRLLPLDRDRRRSLLRRWFGRRRSTVDPKAGLDAAEQSLAIIEADRSLWELSGNPLYLTLMAMLLEEGTTPERNRTLLYDQIFELLMEGKHRREPEPMDAQEVTREVLRRLAHGMTKDGVEAEPVIRLEARLLEEDLDVQLGKLERHPRWRRSLRTFFEDLAERTGILGPHDSEEADWRYWHRTFREALTAERLEGLMAEGGREAVLAEASAITGQDAGRWAEPYALLTGRVDEPDQLVRDLAEANRALGLRALATARTLSPETVPEILGLTGSVRERSQVYAELPRLIPDSRTLLALIDRLRRDTHNGDDLFWLDWVARQVAMDDSQQRPEVEALLGRFYDHLPTPPTDSFTKVETIDGEVDLWCSVPMGEFMMGSPESEIGHDYREGPLHAVEVRSAFRLAAVPVTRAQYAAFDPDHRSNSGEDTGPGLPEHPVDSITWHAAVAFCRWLSQALPATAGARLPTEGEWEYACRAGSETAYWSGKWEDDLARVGWYGGNSGGHTQRVGQKQANDWGLYDVHGNVFEWTLSRWTNSYTERRGGAIEDPRSVSLDKWISTEGSVTRGRVKRGGSCVMRAPGARSASRVANFPEDPWSTLSFRVALPSTRKDGA